jgi:nicotinate phosphoribosyltransferase
MQLNREAYVWLNDQINGSPFTRYRSLMPALGNLRVTAEEIAWLRKKCTYLPDHYLDFLQSFRVYPQKQVTLEWSEDKPAISIIMQGRWIDTILYEIPILALVSEAYFRFVDKDWDYVGQYGIPPPSLH